MRKKGINWDQVTDILIALVLITIFSFIFIMKFVGDSSETRVGERIESFETKEQFLTLLRKPMEKQDVEMETVDFVEGGRYRIMDDGTVELEIPEKRRYHDVELTLSTFSDLAVFSGYDEPPVDVPYVKDPYKPEDFDKIFLSPGADKDLEEWVYEGGKLFASDYAVDELNFGRLETEQRPIEESPLEMEYKGSHYELDKVYWGVRNKSEVNILANYTVDAYGHPIYKFGYGNGEVYYFSFLLKNNGFGEEFRDMMGLEKSEVEDVSVYTGESSNPEKIYTGTFSGEEDIDITSSVNSYIYSECDSFPCSFPVKVETGEGKAVIKNPRVSKKQDSYRPYYDVADMIMDGKEEKVREVMKGFVEEHSTQMSSSGYEMVSLYKVKIQGDDIDIDLDYEGDRMGMEIKIVDMELPDGTRIILKRSLPE